MTSKQPSAMVYRVITLSFESRCYRQSLNALKYLAVVTSKLHHHTNLAIKKNGLKNAFTRVREELTFH